MGLCLFIPYCVLFGMPCLSTPFQHPLIHVVAEFCSAVMHAHINGVTTKPGLWTLDWTGHSPVHSMEWTGLWTGLNYRLVYKEDAETVFYSALQYSKRYQVYVAILICKMSC